MTGKEKNEARVVLDELASICDDITAKNEHRKKFPTYKKRTVPMKEKHELKLDTHGVIALAIACFTLLGLAALTIWAFKG